MSWSKISLFLSGLFFGGALDHVFLAVKGSPFTPYGVRSGVRGNWALAALDGALALMLYGWPRRRETQE